VLILSTLLICGSSQVFLCQAQPSCEVLKNDDGTQKKDGSRLCINLKIKDGKLDIDRSPSRFAASDEFTRRLAIPPTQAEEIVFATLAKLLNEIPKPYRFALSETAKADDGKGILNDPLSNGIRTANKGWDDYLQQFSEWATQTHQEKSMEEVFSQFEADALTPLVKAHETTALLIWEDGSFDAERGTFTFVVLDPISNWEDQNQVKISFPDLPEGPKTNERRKRLIELLRPLAGQPRCHDCIKLKLESFYKRLGLDPDLSFDDQNTSPLLIGIIESKRIIGASWKSLDSADPNIDKLMYSLLTDQAFRLYLKHRTQIKTDQVFNYRQQTGQPGPYLNAQRLQIQQLLVNQLGYGVSVTVAPGENGTSSNFNLTIQKLSDLEEADAEAAGPESTNETPDAAPPTANPEGVVTAHEQERKTETDFTPKAQPERDVKHKDKKRYVGFGIEYRPGQGPKFFGLGQLSRFPFLPESVNNVSAKGGGQGTDGALGSTNYFSDYLFFDTLHRRVSLQLTLTSDLDADRVLNNSIADERRRTGIGRIEVEPFRDLSGSLLRFFVEGRHETVAIDPGLQPTTKLNLTTLEFGAFFFFESIQVERPRRIRVEPKFKFGLGLAVGEPRYNKFLTTGNFHQMLAAGYEIDIGGRIEAASTNSPSFELPSFGGAEVVRGFRKDDGLGRKVWSLQNELWIPLPIGNELSTGIKAMLRDKVKVAAFVDVGGVYNTTTVKPGTRVGTGLGLRIIYNPVIFKVDYGYGFGDKVTGGARGKVHFSVGTNLPF